MITFLERWQGKARSLATFGDSITQALHIDPPDARWANRLATLLGVTLANRGLSGTVLQNSPDGSGRPRAGNGRSRYVTDLLGPECCELIAILYGTNDARYTAAPATLNHDGFVRDYRAILAGLFGAGYAPDTIVIGSPPHFSDAGFAVGADEGFAGQTREGFQRYVGTVRSIARTAGTYYAPVNEAMTSPEADALLLADHVHPNAAGHARIAEIFAGATQLTTETSP